MVEVVLDQMSINKSSCCYIILLRPEFDVSRYPLLGDQLISRELHPLVS